MRSLTTSLAKSPLLWVLTARTGAGSPAIHEATSALERDGAQVLRLTAVSTRAVADIVADDLRADADASLLALADKTHGNPFLLMELLQGLREEDRIQIDHGRATATGQGLPHRLSEGMQQRLERLSHDARQVVQVAAVLPDRFSATTLAAMLERRPTSLVSAVHEAIHADLLVADGAVLRFRHDLLRQATRQSMPGSLRRAMEREAVWFSGGVSGTCPVRYRLACDGAARFAVPTWMRSAAMTAGFAERHTEGSHERMPMSIATFNPTGLTPARWSRRVRAMCPTLWSGSLETIVVTRSWRRGGQVFRKVIAAEGRLSEDWEAAAVCRELNVSEETHHRGRDQFGGLKAEGAKLLEDLERENATLKRLFVDAKARLEQVTAELERAAPKDITGQNS